jgi:hypothetical protein
MIFGKAYFSVNECPMSSSMSLTFKHGANIMFPDIGQVSVTFVLHALLWYAVHSEAIGAYWAHGVRMSPYESTEANVRFLHNLGSPPFTKIQTGLNCSDMPNYNKSTLVKGLQI